MMGAPTPVALRQFYFKIQNVLFKIQNSKFKIRFTNQYGTPVQRCIGVKVLRFLYIAYGSFEKLSNK